jgi:hypothetical protein
VRDRAARPRAWIRSEASSDRKRRGDAVRWASSVDSAPEIERCGVATLRDVLWGHARCDHPVVSRTAAIVAAVTTVSGIAVVIAAIAVASGWETGQWFELLLVLSVVIFVFAAGVVAATFAITTFIKTAALFLIPEQPPALVRISAVMEQRQAERDTASSERPGESPPAILIELQALCKRDWVKPADETAHDGAARR